MIPETRADVEDRLRRTLTGAGEECLTGIATEASTVVEDYLDIEYDEQPAAT